MEKVIGIVGAFGKAILAIVLMVVAVLVADVIMVAFDYDHEVYEGLFSTIYSVVLILLFGIIIYYTGNVSGGHKLRKSPLDPLDLFWLFVIALGMLGLTTIYLIIANELGKVSSEVSDAVDKYNESMEREATEEEIVLIPNWDHWLYFFSSFILIPLAEEMMFRGYVLEGFAKHMKEWVAVIVSAIIFGLLHGVSVQIGYALICGLFLGSVYVICDNLLASYVVHAVFNLFGAALYMLIDSGALGQISESSQNSIYGAIFMLEMGSILFLLPSFYFISVRRNKVFKPNDRLQALMRHDITDRDAGASEG